MMKNLFDVVHNTNKTSLGQKKDTKQNLTTNIQFIGRKTSKILFKVDHCKTDEKPLKTNKEEKANKNSQLFNKENSNLFSSYAFDNYEKSRYLDNRELINLNQLPRQKSFFRLRTKIIDFMVEVFSSFSKSDIHTLFHAARLMDAFLSKSHVDDKQFFLVGVTCIFISSKYEDTHCISMQTLLKNVAHDSLTMDQIRQQEMLILNTIEWDLMFTTTYEFIKTFFFDFSQNNKKKIEELRLEQTIQTFESTAIAVAMIMLHNEHFSGIKNITKAIVSILYALNLIFSDQIHDTYITSFMRDWVECLVQESQSPVEYVNLVFKNLEEYIDEYKKIQYIGKHAWKYLLD